MDISLQKKEVAPASAGVERFIVADGMICMRRLSGQFIWLGFADAFAYPARI